MHSLIFDTVVDTVDFVAWPENVKPPASTFLISSQEGRKKKQRERVSLWLSVSSSRSVSPAVLDISTFSVGVVISLGLSSSLLGLDDSLRV